MEEFKDRMNKMVKKIYNTYKSISAPAKASIWFVICSVMQRGVSLLTTPIFTRILTSNQYGVFSVYQSWYSIISILATLNLSAGVYNNGLAKYSQDRYCLTSAFQGLSTTITMCLFVVYVLNVEFWNDLLGLSTLFVLAMFMELLFVPAYQLWSVKQRFDYKYKGVILVTGIITVGSPIIGIIAILATEHKAEARVLSFVLVQVVVGLVFYIYNMYRGKKFFSLKYWTFALKFNLPLIPHYLSMTILNQSDRIMISRLVGESEAAIYSIAYTLAMLMTVVTNAVNNSFIPYTYKELRAGRHEGIKKTSAFLLVLIGMGCILVMAFGPELIMLIATEEYYDAIWVIPPVAASVYFMFLYPLFGNIEFYYEKTKFVMIASCCGSIMNIILNLIFINICGYYAAGYTTLACYIIFSYAHYVFYKKIIRDKLPEISNIYNIKLILGLSVLLLVAMIIMTVSYTNIFLRYMFIILLLVAIIWKRKEIIMNLREFKKSD